MEDTKLLLFILPNLDFGRILWSFILNVNAISKSISHHLCRAGSGLLVWPLLFLMWTDSWNKRNQEKMDDPFFLIFFNVKMEFHHRNLTLFSLTLHWIQNKKSWKDKCLTFAKGQEGFLWLIFWTSLVLPLILEQNQTHDKYFWTNKNNVQQFYELFLKTL